MTFEPVIVATRETPETVGLVARVTRVVGSVWTFLAAAAIVAACVLLIVPSSPAAAQRVAHLESLVKCPACDDLSVAESNAPSAIAVRNEIVHDVKAGWSDTTILTTLEGQYGSSILLSPSGSTLDDLLWVTPVAILVIGLALFGRLARRRR
jgi:cytochrome c-type biogenesis protein CcmH/NrfF